MRTNESPWDIRPTGNPCGERVTPPTPPTTAQPPKPVGSSAIVTDSEGRMRTTNHKPRP